MRIACVDKSAADRISLERFLEEGFRECRKSIGHLIVARLFPISKEELLINAFPEAIVIGAGFSVDESLLLAREIRGVSQSVPIYVFLQPDAYTVSNLKRFESYVTDIFSLSDLASRFVFKLTSVSEDQNGSAKGCLLAWLGVKGGVGTTSLVGAAAHAFQDIGKSVAVVDFSRRGEFCQFFLSDKWQSSFYSQLIADGQLPDQEHLDKMLVHLPNGITVLPPPAGMDEVREQWLRDPLRLEIGLSVVDLMLERFDVVLVDFAHAEGILPFAIECRADARIFVSANDPGSVHLLVQRVEDFSLPVEGVTKFLINQTQPDGLNKEDVLDFVAWSSSFKEEMLYPSLIPYEARATHWMGTGNSLFTESPSKFQNILKQFVRDAIGLEEQERKERKMLPFFYSQKIFAKAAYKNLISELTKEKPVLFHNATKVKPQKVKKPSTLRLENCCEQESAKGAPALSEEIGLDGENAREDFIYAPPQIRANQKI